MQRIGKLFVTVLALGIALQPPASGDPCGMVPPLYLGQGAPIVRVGTQRTYVFHKDGMETLVLRPGFEGKVEEFGMLIPFPSPPAIRKVADDVFGHVAAAVDPPEVIVDLRPEYYFGAGVRTLRFAMGDEETLKMVRRDEVRVIREEAVGMYQVAVLDAGSAAALQAWMDEHGFRYPEGMDATCEEYVQEGWCFVAVKAAVGNAAASQPQPGMREVDTSLPAGAGFDGHVQAMGFRFMTDELVVPMRLSAFNEGPLRNVVYVLAEGGRSIEGIAEQFVVRQVPGSKLIENLTAPLPLRVLGGTLDEIPLARRASLPTERDPQPHNGIARELFASDLLASRLGMLALSFEEREKQLLAIDEALGLRGPEIDALRHAALAGERERLLANALAGLEGMTLSVIDGDFPREVLAAANLRFPDYAMADEKNAATTYDAKLEGPAQNWGGTLLRSAAPPLPPAAAGGPQSGRLLLGFGLVALAILGASVRSGRRSPRAPAVVCLALLAGGVLIPTARAQETPALVGCCRVSPSCEEDPVLHLILDARSGETLVSRGQAIVELTLHRQDEVRELLRSLWDNDSDPLVRAWAGAARIALADTGSDLCALTMKHRKDAVLARPLAQRWQALMAEGVDLSLEDAFEALSGDQVLMGKVLPLLLAQDLEAFVALMTSSPNQQVRLQAAGALASLGQGGEGNLARMILRTYRFDPDAERVPWTGGPLYVPGLTWTRGQARQLAGDLVAWMLWCDHRADQDAKQQIVNNLVSIGIAHVAGYASPGGTVDVVPWLRSWAQCAGRAEVERMLALQGLEGEERFRALLDSIGG